MEYIIFCVCSIIVARFLEKTSRVVSVAHDILFIVLSFAFFFATNNPHIAALTMRIVGKDIYTTLHTALIESQNYVHLGMSVLFIIEGVVITITTIAAIIIFVKSLKEVVKSIKIKTINDIDLSLFKEDESYIPNKTISNNNQNRYLLNCCLLN